MKLIPVDPGSEEHLKVLYALLAERTPEQSISHKRMPTWEEHVAFVSRMSPWSCNEVAYANWDLIEVEGRVVGAIYSTDRNEIGISIFKAHQRKGYGPAAISAQRGQRGGGPCYANINPANEPSRKMFEKLGFKLVQYTFALEAE